MIIPDFKLEHFFDTWEFVAPLMLGSSDAETLGLEELLALADDETAEWWRSLRLGYTEGPGHPRLRAVIASLYEAAGPDDIVVFSGAQEAIFAFMNVAVAAGDHVVATWPGYQSLFEVPRSLGAAVTLVRLAHDEAWAFPLDRFVAAIEARPATAIIVNYPHSPTGAQLDKPTFARVMDLARGQGAYVLCDEVYRFAEHADGDRLQAAVDAYERGVSVGVMSKAFGLAGLRIGWIATRDPALRRRLISFKHYLTICGSATSEVLATIALGARATILARNRAIVGENLAQLDGFFARWEGVFEWVRPKAGTVAFPRLLGGISIDAFADELAREEGVLLLPGSVFDVPGNHFRVGYGRRHLPEALARLERFAGHRLR